MERITPLLVVVALILWVSPDPAAAQAAIGTAANTAANAAANAAANTAAADTAAANTECCH